MASGRYIYYDHGTGLLAHFEHDRAQLLAVDGAAAVRVDLLEQRDGLLDLQGREVVRQRQRHRVALLAFLFEALLLLLGLLLGLVDLLEFIAEQHGGCS